MGFDLTTMTFTLQGFYLREGAAVDNTTWPRAGKEERLAAATTSNTDSDIAIHGAAAAAARAGLGAAFLCRSGWNG